VSDITDQRWDDYRAFRTPDLSGIEVSNLFLNGVYQRLRRYGARGGDPLCLVLMATFAKMTSDTIIDCEL
jgi:hypothetical protein